MAIKNHNWSGWPGAYCLTCGSEDPMESALAMNWYDPYTNTFDTVEHEKIVREANICKEKIKKINKK